MLVGWSEAQPEEEPFVSFVMTMMVRVPRKHWAMMVRVQQKHSFRFAGFVSSVPFALDESP
jgi:hypothetical protein